MLTKNFIVFIQNRTNFLADDALFSFHYNNCSTFLHGSKTKFYTKVFCYLSFTNFFEKKLDKKLYLPQTEQIENFNNWCSIVVQLKQLFHSNIQQRNASCLRFAPVGAEQTSTGRFAPHKSSLLTFFQESKSGVPTGIILPHFEQISSSSFSIVSSST